MRLFLLPASTTGMENMDSKKILQKIFPAAEDEAQHLDKYLTRAYQKQIKSYRRLLEIFIQALEQKEEDQDYYLALWEKLSEHFKKIIQWIDSFNHSLEYFTEDNLQAAWGKRFTAILTENPTEIKFNIPDDFWIRKAEDTFFISSGKRVKLFLIRCEYYGIHTLNKILKLLNLSPLKQTPPSCKFQLHNFMITYLDLPVRYFYLQEWQRFLKKTASHLFQLHQACEKLENDFLILNNFESICNDWDATQKISETRHLRDHLKLIRTLERETKEFKAGLKDRFAEKSAEIGQEFKRNWELAGTFALPNRNFNQKKVFKLRNELGRQLAKIKHSWSIHFEGERKEWLKDLELSIFQLRSATLCRDTLRMIRKKVNEKIIPAVMEADRSIADSLEKIKTTDSDAKTELKRAILAESHTLLRRLRQEELPRIMDAVLHANIEQAFKGYVVQIQNSLELLTDKHIIFRYRDLENLPPQSKTDEVQLKELAREEIIPQLLKKHQDFSENINQRIKLISRAISEIDQIVEFNLEAALNFLQKDQETGTVENAHKIVVEGLERTQGQIKELMGKFIQIQDRIQDSLPEMTLNMENKIQELQNSEKVFELKIRLARVKARQEFRQFWKKIWNRFKSAIYSLIPFIISSLKKIRGGYFRFRKITGLTPTAVNIDEKLSQYLTETTKRIAQLPYIYQRLFRLEPLTDSRFFTGREKEMALMKDDFSNWREGRNTAMIVVGERGSGKTTLLNFAEAEIYKGLPIIKVELKKTISQEADLLDFLKATFNEPAAETFDDLEKKLINQESRKICIFENLHDLYLRTVEGFDALERFLLFVSKTQQKIYWIVTCASYGWQYLDKVLETSKYFQRILVLGTQTKDEIAEIILKRHRVSGYNCVYEIPEEFKNQRKFSKITSDKGRQAYLEDQMFEQLAELSTGNTRVAILFWLTAIRNITKEQLVLSPKIEFNHTFLYQLSAKELFTLAALIQHEILDPQEHALIFHQDINDSLLVMNRMLNKGFLQKSEVGYFVHPFLYRPAVKALKSKNILH